MSVERLPSSPEGSPNTTLRLVPSAEKSATSSEHETHSPVLFDFDTDKVSGVKITQHVEVLANDRLAPVYFKKADIAEYPRIIIHALLHQLNIQADIHSLPLNDSTLSEEQKGRIVHTLSIEQLYDDALACIADAHEQKTTSSLTAKLYDYIEENHQQTSVLRTFETLIPAIPHAAKARDTILITRRILWTMLYLKDPANQP